jgi:putative SOS response-associated peptidase YedK
MVPGGSWYPSPRMCGRITLTSSARELAQQFELREFELGEFELGEFALGAEQEAALGPRFNIAPSQDIATVRQNRSGARELSFERWGLVPHWADNPAIGNRMINARAESVASKPAFRDALRSRRCVVPADGFYEWSGTGAERRPYIFRRPDRAMIGIAGLYERWLGEGGEVVDSCTLITTEANGVLAAFHDRMPVILSPADYDRWLDRSLQEPAEVTPLLVPCPDDWLDSGPVSTRINNPRNDDPECLIPEPVTGNLFG